MIAVLEGHLLPYFQGAYIRGMGLIFGGKFVLVIRGAYIRGAYIRGGLYSEFYGTLKKLVVKLLSTCLKSNHV